jgi:hypothetical protein
MKVPANSLRCDHALLKFLLRNEGENLPNEEVCIEQIIYCGIEKE